MTLAPRARFVLDQLADAGGPVGRWDLVDLLPPGADDDGLLRVYISRLRDILGSDAIVTARGLGYPPSHQLTIGVPAAPQWGI